MAAPALAQALVNSTTVSGSTAFGTFGANTTTGNTIVVFSYFSGATLATVSGIAVSTGAATFVKVLAVPGVGGSIPSLEVWAAPNITGGTTPQVTVTYSIAPGATAADVVLFELNGVPANLTPDGVPAGISNAAAGTALSAPKTSTTQNGDLIFAAFATPSAVTAGTGGWTNTITQHLSCSVEYLSVSSVQTNLIATATQTSSNSYGALVFALASSTAVPQAPAQAVSAGCTVLTFDEEFVLPPDIGISTDGHKWNSGLFYSKPIPPATCYTNALSVETLIARVPVTTTSGTFPIPASNGAVTVPLVAPSSGYSASVGDVLYITDGTNVFAGNITTVTSSTSIIVTAQNYPGSQTTGTMGSGATVNYCGGVSLGTLQPDSLGGTSFLGGYYECLMYMTDWSSFWLFDSSRVMGLATTPTNPYSWNNELDIIEGDSGAGTDAVVTLHKNTPGAGGVPDSINSPNNVTAPAPVMQSWHKFGALWTKSTVSWYFDDVLLTSTPAFGSTWKPCNLILQAASGGVNGTSSNVIPPQTQFDWVRVWQVPLVNHGPTISVIQSAKNQVAATTNSCAFGSGVTSGNALIVFAYMGPLYQTVNVTDTLGNNYYTVPLLPDDSNYTHQIQAFYCISAASGANTITCGTVSGSTLTYINLIIYEVSFGAGNTGLIDQSVAHVYTSATTAPNSGTTFATVLPNEIVFGFFGCQTAFSAGQAGFTATISTDSLALGQYKIVSATGTQTTTATVASGNPIGVTVTFMAPYASSAPSNITVGGGGGTVAAILSAAGYC